MRTRMGWFAALVLWLGGCGAPSLSGVAIIKGASNSAGITIDLLSETGLPVGATVTEASGAWRLAGVPKGIYELRATGRSTKESSITIQVLVDTGSVAPRIEFTGVGRAKGHVVQPAGCHYPVQITEGDALVATADSSGDFAAELTVGDHALVLASEPRLELPSISTKYDDLTDLGMIQMRVQTGRVAGRVVVTGAGNPTSASTCDLPWPGFTSTLTLSGGACTYSMTVGPPGTYAFEAVGVGDYRLTVTTPPSAELDHTAELTGQGPLRDFTVSAGATVTEDFTGFHGFGFATGRVHLADGGLDYSGLNVGINNASAHLPTAGVDDGGTYSVRTTCGQNQVCLGPNYTNCVDVTVPYNDAGIAPMDLVY